MTQTTTHRAAALLREIERRGGRVRVDGDELVIRAPGGVVDDQMMAAVRACKPALLAMLRGSDSGPAEDVAGNPEPETDPLRQLLNRVGAAPSWAALGAILDDAQRAYEMFALTAEEVERIAEAAIVRSRLVPEGRRPPAQQRATGSVREPGVYAADLLPAGPVATCPACGQTEWWTDGTGTRKCGVCHPQPGGGR